MLFNIDLIKELVWIMIKWLDLELKLIQLFFKFLKIDYLKKLCLKKKILWL